MNTETEVIGEHEGINYHSIPGWPGYGVTKCGKVFSTRLGRWSSAHSGGQGYLSVKLTGPDKIAKSMGIHRLMGLAFLAVGSFHVDHMNRIKTDNRLENLRAVTRADNTRNKVMRGVRKRCSKWQARINDRGRYFYLGSYETEELAHAAYLSKKRELGHLAY